MFNRVRVISGLLGVLALFVLLQLISGSAFFQYGESRQREFCL
ncbi:Tar ligand binding domain-containing protein [Pantoea tagorei]